MAGDEDRTTSGRRRQPLSTALAASRDVVVDLSDLEFADTSVMVDLACLAQRMRAQGQTVQLRGARPNVQWLIETMGLDRLPAVELGTVGA